MTSQLPPSLVRLAAANPVVADQSRGLAPGAQAVLARILETERESARRIRRPGRRRVVAVLIVATALAGCGAALRAADPFGFWRSAAPGTARYGVNPAVHVRAPSASEIGCSLKGSAGLTCRPGGRGIRYVMISDTITASPRQLTRQTALRAVEKGRAKGTLSSGGARRLRADILAVPGSFFAAILELGRFQTFSAGSSGPNGKELVPPRGVPIVIACAQLRASIECRNLNGDEHAPVGAGIYAAERASNWVSRPTESLQAAYASSERLIVAVLGHPLTTVELRLLIDLGRYGTVSRSGGVVQGHSAPKVRSTKSTAGS
jgi:hypothetical protein